MKDPRNVVDEFKGWQLDDIVRELDKRGTGLEIAIENTERDFNMGTIVRSANAFGVRHLHVVGRRQWNKRGAMATDKYLHIWYYESADEFIEVMKTTGKSVIAVDNIQGSQGLADVVFPKDSVLVFGQEGPGISTEMASKSDNIVAIEQFGSTRSINVGVAAGIVMYAWIRQHALNSVDR